jgi:hypothetical protein
VDFLIFFDLPKKVQVEVLVEKNYHPGPMVQLFHF